MRLTFTIQRFNPEIDSTSHPQEIRLDVGRGMTVLDALIRIKQECDGSLALRYSCRSAICGSCAMTINGSAKLSSRTSLRKELERHGHITVAPLRSHLGVVDLGQDDIVVGFREAPLLPFWVNTGLYVLDDEAIARLPERGDHETTTFPELASGGASERGATRASG